MRCQCVGGQRIPDVRDAVTSDNADQARVAVLTAFYDASHKTAKLKTHYPPRSALEIEGMSTTTGYLVSLGIIGAFAIWVNVGTTLRIGFGVPTIVVGLISLSAELRD